MAGEKCSGSAHIWCLGARDYGLRNTRELPRLLRIRVKLFEKLVLLKANEYVGMGRKVHAQARKCLNGL